MKKIYSIEEIQELAASYALGVLSPEEKEEFETIKLLYRDVYAHELRSFTEVVELLSYKDGPLEANEALEERLFSRIEKEKEDRVESGFSYVRSDEGEWAEVVKGVWVKNLFEDPEHSFHTVLVRMDPGSTFPDHVHADAEECYIIDGQLNMGGQVFKKGDYIRADADSVHESISTDIGCTLFIQSSKQNEMLA